MNLGCFALIDAFSTLDHQLDRIRDLGFSYADVTDNTDGACLGVEFGFTAVASLDANPFDLKRAFDERGLTISSYCAHANLLDPSAPWRYQTAQIVKAIRAAASIGVRHVITTEGEPRTDFGRALSDTEAALIVKERLVEPLRLAEDLGVRLLLEPHGRLTTSIDGMERLLDACDSPVLGVNMDTGNSWLGGADPVAMVERLGSRIEHVHWKDLGEEWIAQRGQLHGCGMATIPLGSGVIDIDGVIGALQRAGFDGHTTLEIAGDDAVLASRDFLAARGAIAE